MSKIRVAVLRGGPSPEYDVSLKTGGHVLALLRALEDKYEPIDIFISRDGEWHHGGLVHEPYEALRHADVVWNAVHGAYGEDGQVQKLLVSLNIPYTGSSAFSSALAHNKDVTKQYYEKYSLLTPRYETLSLNTLTESKLINIFRNYLHPVVVKPATSGSSIGMRIARDFLELRNAVVDSFELSDKVIVEEFIRGREATCSVIDNAKGEITYALIPSGNSTPEENRLITAMSKRAHNVLNLSHFSSSDFIITPRGKVYILETDAVPAFHKDSHLHHSLESTGWKPHDFAHHCIELALQRKDHA